MKPIARSVWMAGLALSAASAVWGATAMILGEFACLFDDTHGPETPPDRF